MDCNNQVALGDKIAGLYSPDDKLRKDIESAAKRTDESLWAMPLPSEYKDMIKSHIADLKVCTHHYVIYHLV